MPAPSLPPFVDRARAACERAAMVAVGHGWRAGLDLRAIARSTRDTRVVARGDVIDQAAHQVGQSLSITVYRAGGVGVAVTTAFDAKAIDRTVAQAAAIAAHVTSDRPTALADPAWLAGDRPAPPLLAIGNGTGEIDVLTADARAMAGHALRHAAEQDAAVRIGEAGATIGTGIWTLATTHGFLRSAPYGSAARWCMVLADDADGAAIGVEEVVTRQPDAFDVAAIGALAARRALARRGARALAGRPVAALFDARTAATLVHDAAHALTGNAQARRRSFWPDAGGCRVLPPHVDLHEDPFEPYGLASGGFDSEGVAGHARAIVDAGVVRGLFHDCRSAREMGTVSTGNADGPYNLRLTSRTAGGDDDAMRAALGTGLMVTELMGGATDPVTGRWTRAAAGFWIEDGAVAFPVRDITLAGALPDMLRGIVRIGSETARVGAVRTGPILIDTLHMGGA